MAIWAPVRKGALLCKLLLLLHTQVHGLQRQPAGEGGAGSSAWRRQPEYRSLINVCCCVTCSWILTCSPSVVCEVTQPTVNCKQLCKHRPIPRRRQGNWKSQSCIAAYTATESVPDCGPHRPVRVQVQCGFTATEIVRTTRDGKSRTATSTFTHTHSSWALTLRKFSVTLRPQRPLGLLGTGSPRRPPRLSHTQPLSSDTEQVQCYFTATETIRTIRDGEPKTATSTFTYTAPELWHWASSVRP